MQMPWLFTSLKASQASGARATMRCRPAKLLPWVLVFWQEAKAAKAAQEALQKYKEVPKGSGLPKVCLTLRHAD